MPTGSLVSTLAPRTTKSPLVVVTVAALAARAVVVAAASALAAICVVWVETVLAVASISPCSSTSAACVFVDAMLPVGATVTVLAVTLVPGTSSV